MNMKNVIILGGNSPNNINWIKSMEKTYKTDYNVSTLSFDNWQDNTMINFNRESKKLVSLCEEKENYIIIAKSAGAISVAQAIKSKRIKPKLLIVMGFPLQFSLDNNINIKSLFNDISKVCKILVIQQKYDPQGNAKKISELLDKNILIKIINGNNHVYANFNLIKEQVDSFIDMN